MAFSSLAFLAFLPAVCALVYLLPGRQRPMVLLGASLFFYLSFGSARLPLFLATAATSYGAALWIAATGQARTRKLVLTLCLAVNIGLLFAVKYAAFAGEAVNAVLARIAPGLAVPVVHTLLPIGISFYTFQSLAYVIDVYRGHIAPDRRPDRLVLFLGYFPLLPSGPIERAGHLQPQLRQKIGFDYDLAVAGLRLMLWGFFKKLVIADNLGTFVDRIFAAPLERSGPVLVLAAMAYGYQLFCDFSGYCDIAVGCSRLFGVELVQNFRQPYHSASVREFWRRWHISLSTWFRDYLYIPLGGGRGSPLAVSRNLLVVFLACGLWHGANWTFVVWGGLHGLYLVASRLLAPVRAAAARGLGLESRPLTSRVLAVAFTYALVHFAWIFFRAESLSQALAIVARLPKGWGGFVAALPAAVPKSLQELLLAGRAFFLESPLPAILVCEAVMLLESGGRLGSVLGSLPRAGRLALYSALGWWIVAFGNFGHGTFIYFAF